MNWIGAAAAYLVAKEAIKNSYVSECWMIHGDKEGIRFFEWRPESTSDGW